MNRKAIYTDECGLKWRRCADCMNVFLLEYFVPRKAKGYYSYCPTCTKRRRSEQHFKRQDKNNQYGRDMQRAYRKRIIEYYSNGTMACACCGENIIEFLCIDHINGGGKKHRKEEKITSIHRWLIKNNFPPGFQVLCHNCNMAKGFYGECPHQTQRKLESN